MPKIGTIITVDFDSIFVDFRGSMRRTYDAWILQELADSILQNGLINPILVCNLTKSDLTRRKDSARIESQHRYILATGYARYMALAILLATGHDVPVQVLICARRTIGNVILDSEHRR